MIEKHNYKIPWLIFVFSLLIVFVVNISFVRLVADSKYIGWLTNGTYVFGIAALSPYIFKKAKFIEGLYISVMIIGLLFHAYLNNIENLINDSFKWIYLIFLIIGGRVFRIPRISYLILISFFIIHCAFAINEYYRQIHIFDYNYVEKFENFIDNSQFRAFGLMEHPLYGANIVLIIMSFILVSKDVNKFIKTGLVLIGSLALVSFNSRAAILIWVFLLIYHFILFNKKGVVVFAFGLIIYIFYLDVSFLLEPYFPFLGRLGEENNLTDSSAMTRFMSYIMFWNERWNFQDIVFGGRVLFMPGTDVSLENGILLHLAWWGWIIGALKILLELVISYSCLKKYSFKNRIMVMIACWGCAFANNNSMNTFVFAFFIISYLSMNSLSNKNYLRQLRVKYVRRHGFILNN